jgi:hypothetical protein
MLPVPITTERDKVKITGLLIADEGPGHLNIVNPRLKRETWGIPNSDPGHQSYVRYKLS